MRVTACFTENDLTYSCCATTKARHDELALEGVEGAVFQIPMKPGMWAIVCAAAVAGTKNTLRIGAKHHA